MSDMDGVRAIIEAMQKQEDTITALRAEVEQYRETLDRQIGLTIQTAEDHQVIIDRLSAEVERLLAASESPFMDGYETAKEEYRPRLIKAEDENERLRKLATAWLDYIERTAPFFGMKEARAELEERT